MIAQVLKCDTLDCKIWLRSVNLLQRTWMQEDAYMCERCCLDQRYWKGCMWTIVEMGCLMFDDR